MIISNFTLRTYHLAEQFRTKNGNFEQKNENFQQLSEQLSNGILSGILEKKMKKVILKKLSTT